MEGEFKNKIKLELITIGFITYRIERDSTDHYVYKTEIGVIHMIAKNKRIRTLK